MDSREWSLQFMVRLDSNVPLDHIAACLEGVLPGVKDASGTGVFRWSRNVLEVARIGFLTPGS